MRVIIAGGRDFVPTDRDIARLEDLHAEHGFTEVVSGAARGADAFGEWWANRRRIPAVRFLAAWKQDGKAAGPIRNRKMADYADALIAFHGGKGTADMLRAAEERGLKILHREDTPTGAGR